MCRIFLHRMKRFLLLLFSGLLIVSRTCAQSPWLYDVGFSLMPHYYIPPHDYIPQHDENSKYLFRLGYSAGPSFIIHKDIFSFDTRLRYCRININAEYSDEGVHPISGYYKIESHYKQSFNNIELSILPGIESGENKNKFGIHTGAIVSYLYGVRYSGTFTINSQTTENSGYNQKEDWIWQAAFSLSYIYTMTDRFRFKLEPQLQYSFKQDYFLTGVNIGIDYRLQQ